MTISRKILLTTLLLFAFCFMSFASADQVMTEEGTKTTLVYLDVPCDFRIVIPEKIAFVERERGTSVFISVRAYGVYLWDGSRLNVTVSSKNGWELCEDKDHYGYSVSKEGSTTALKNGDNVLSIPSGTISARQVLDLTLDDTVITAGEFTDKLTFTLSID